MFEIILKEAFHWTTPDYALELSPQRCFHVNDEEK